MIEIGKNSEVKDNFNKKDDEFLDGLTLMIWGGFFVLVGIGFLIYGIYGG